MSQDMLGIETDWAEKPTYPDRPTTCLLTGSVVVGVTTVTAVSSLKAVASPGATAAATATSGGWTGSALNVDVGGGGARSWCPESWDRAGAKAGVEEEGVGQGESGATEDLAVSCTLELGDGGIAEADDDGAGKVEGTGEAGGSGEAETGRRGGGRARDSST